MANRPRSEAARSREVPISLVGLPYHLGSRGRSSGYQMALGPEVLLQDSHLPASFREAFDDSEVVWVVDADEANELDNGGDFRTMPRGDQMTRHLVQAMHLSRAVQDVRRRGRLPIGVLGNCSASLGMVGGLDTEGAGLIWFDAHSDAMTPDTSSNGFFEGMPVSTIAGKCWPTFRRRIPGFHEIPEERIITVGNHEIHWEGGRGGVDHALGALVDPPAISSLGFAGAMDGALDRLTAHTDRVYVHIDVDVLDPTVLRGNSHCAPGGLDLEKMEYALSAIAARAEILAVSTAAYDPDVDPRGPSVLVPLITQVASIAAGSRHLTSSPTP